MILAFPTHGVCIRFLGGVEEAEDVVQRRFLQEGLKYFSLRFWGVCQEVWAVSVKVVTTAYVEVPHH